MNTLPPFTKAGFTVILATLSILFVHAEEAQVAVSGIAMGTSQSQQGTSATATVVVTDKAGQPISGALVTGNWSGLTTSKGSGLTNRQGRATFHSARTLGQGTFVFNVATVAAAGATYNAALNTKSHESVASIAGTEVTHVTTR